MNSDKLDRWLPLISWKFGQTCTSTSVLGQSYYQLAKIKVKEKHAKFQHFHQTNVSPYARDMIEPMVAMVKHNQIEINANYM